MRLEIGLLAEQLLANVALVRFLLIVDQVVSLEVGHLGETLLANVALVRFLPSVDQVVLLEVGQLGESLGADVALEGALARMRPQVNFQVGQLAERIVENVALVVHFSVLLLQRVRQRAVAAPLASVGIRTARSDGRQRSASGRGVALQGLAVVGTER